MTELYESINPEILVWAREESGMTIEDISKKMGLKSTTLLQEYESGKKKVKKSHLLKLSNFYNKPL